MSQPICLLRVDRVVERRARSRAQLYVDIQRGTMTPPIRPGKFSCWPEHEVNALIRAEIAGATPDELRALVQQLVAQRVQVAC